MANTTFDPLFEQLELRFREFKGAYGRLDAVANREIVRWRHSLQEAFLLGPAAFERINTRPGILMDEEPDADDFYAYGYDQYDRVIYACRFASDDLPYISTFYTYSDKGVEVVTYRKEYVFGYQLESVGWLLKSSGQNPTHFAKYEVHGDEKVRLFEAFHYDDSNHLMRVERREEIFGARRASDAHEEIFEYEGDKIRRIVDYLRELRGQSFEDSDLGIAIYEALASGETTEAMFEAGRNSLRQAILDKIATLPQAKRDSMRICILGLYYDHISTDSVMIVWKLDEDRQAWERVTKKSSRTWNFESLWNSGSVQTGKKSLELLELPEAYERCVNIYRNGGQFDEIGRLVRQVAHDLNEHHWQGLLNITEDFVVFARNIEDERDDERDLEDDIRDCVPEAKLQVWRDKRLIY